MPCGRPVNPRWLQWVTAWGTEIGTYRIVAGDYSCHASRKPKCPPKSFRLSSLLTAHSSLLLMRTLISSSLRWVNRITLCRRPFSFSCKYSINSANWRRRDFGRRDIFSSCSISALIRFRFCLASRPCSTWLYALANELMAGGKYFTASNILLRHENNYSLRFP